MLAIAQQPFQSKTKDANKRVYGVYQHSTWQLCYTGMFAMTLLTRLFSDVDINFFQPSWMENPEWWGMELLTAWGTTKAAGKVYRKIWRECGIPSWQKCTHM